MVQLWITAPWPMVASAPMGTGPVHLFGQDVDQTPSSTAVPGPMVMGALSPRITADQPM